MEITLSIWQPRLVALASAAAGDDGAHDTNHLHRVWRNANLLLEQHPEADRLVVMAACYLHDLVNLPKNHPERHLASRQAAALARTELAARQAAERDRNWQKMQDVIVEYARSQGYDLIDASPIASAGTPIFDFSYALRAPYTISGPAPPLGATCASPPPITFGGTTTRCIAEP